MAITKTSKLHVNPEIAELVKIYCVLNNVKMSDFTNQALLKELKDFKENLEKIRKISVVS